MTTRTPNPTSHNQWYPFQDRPLPGARDGQPLANPAVVPVVDPQPLPEAVRFVVIGAGVHGMSSAWRTWLLAPSQPIKYAHSKDSRVPSACLSVPV